MPLPQRSPAQPAQCDELSGAFHQPRKILNACAVKPIPTLVALGNNAHPPDMLAPPTLHPAFTAQTPAAKKDFDVRTLDELLNLTEPALPLIEQWVARSPHRCEWLAPSAQREAVLIALNVTTRSVLGAMAYESGGLLIDDGWLRLLGSGHPRLPRNLRDWNQERAQGLMLVADDAVGGFFAINGGALGDDAGALYYWAPDTLRWEALEIGYSDFVEWALSERLGQFYQDLRWDGWQAELEQLSADQCLSFYPFLWTTEGDINRSSRQPVPVSEQYALNLELANTLDGQT